MYMDTGINTVFCADCVAGRLLELSFVYDEPRAHQNDFQADRRALESLSWTIRSVIYRQGTVDLLG